MVRPRLLLVCLTLAAAPLGGCGRVVFQPTAQQPLSLSPEQQLLLAQQQQTMQERADQLDRDNQELEALLAQSRQQLQLVQEHGAATSEQLRAMADQLAQKQQQLVAQRQAEQALQQQMQTLIAEGGAGSGRLGVPAITASNTLLKPLRVTSLPGVDARQDGDVIRVSIPTDQLFTPGGAQLTFGAEQLLKSVADDLLTVYPEQVIGVEGHTDGAPVASPQFPTSHHLSVAQATTVYETFRRVSGAPASQLFVVGHGRNHPLVSNGTEAGRKRNRRVELVIYPESITRR